MKIPTQREELDRKLAIALDWLIERHKKGQSSDEAVSIAADALFMAVSGLVDEDLVNVITAMGAFLPSNAPKPTSRFFVKEGVLMVVSWVPGEDFVSFIRGNGAKSIRQCKSAQEASQMYLAAPSALTNNGYEEIK